MDSCECSKNNPEVKEPLEVGQTCYQTSIEEIKKYIKQTIENAKNALEAGKAKTASTITEDIKKFIAKIIEAAKKIIEKDNIDAAKEWVKKSINQVKETINQVKDTINQTEESVITTIEECKENIEQIKENLSDCLTTVKEKVSSLTAKKEC